MELKYPRAARKLLFVISLLGWFALLSQLYLILQNRVAPVFETVIRYFSFFTILTNILVAVCATMLLQKFKSVKSYFSNGKVLNAIGLYIIVVGLIYNVVLRFLWKPEGLQLVTDELLHTVIPVLYIIFLIICVPKASLKMKDIFLWLIYPFVYLIYILVRGVFSGFYPYPFIDVHILGYNKVLINSGFVLIVFVVFSLIICAMNYFKKADP